MLPLDVMDAEVTMAGEDRSGLDCYAWRRLAGWTVVLLMPFAVSGQSALGADAWGPVTRNNAAHREARGRGASLEQDFPQDERAADVGVWLQGTLSWKRSLVSPQVTISAAARLSRA
ncbi:hypothetical protein OG982_30030 [Streptomyces sp. NBC_01551]|uniref:hypothetical protein n=1 Tax=Streptomyces sp. NBC_01551 TaxID=2975876 RepID=UPI002253C55D|nr:hypothetical protein [Streptomyces sp. NBC_01551]MCX4529883.1 hypothetical protein [Streptomyces sp. NBC_01551]